MPRYIWRRMAEDGKFAMILLRMKDQRSFDFVQLFFTDDVSLLQASDMNGKEIQPSRLVAA